MGISSCKSITELLASPLQPPPPPVFPSQGILSPFTCLLEPSSGQRQGPLVFGPWNVDLLNAFRTSPLLGSLLDTAVRGPSPLAWKLFSGWVPGQLGRQPHLLGGLAGSAPPPAMTASWSPSHATHSFACHTPATVPRVPQHRHRRFSALPLARHTCPPALLMLTHPPGSGYKCLLLSEPPRNPQPTRVLPVSLQSSQCRLLGLVTLDTYMPTSSVPFFGPVSMALLVCKLLVSRNLPVSSARRRVSTELQEG